jgi:ATP-dependent Lon protease
MDILDQKIIDSFPGRVVRKDLTKEVKGNAVVPTFVLEYLLGQYCSTDDESTIREGVDTVKKILQNHYVHRDESELVKSRIREQRNHRIIDKIDGHLNVHRDRYEVNFANLAIKNVPIHSQWINQHPKILTGGVWSLIDIGYQPVDSGTEAPWIVENIKPIQLSSFDLDEIMAVRDTFTTDEWIDMLLQSMGLNPTHFGNRQKLFQLTRLIPYCERNYNLIELGPKGTGKSHVFTEFSPHGMLISGGEVTVAKLFVNNTTGNIGLVGYWDSIAFDEFAGKEKKVQKNMVDIMKNYMAQKSFSRGKETLGAEASLTFIGNTDKSVPYMLKHSNLFEALPKAYFDTAFLDRIHHYIPGWEVDIIRGEMFTDGYGLIVDYYAEGLRSLRKYDYANVYQEYFELDPSIATRDKTAITKTFSGLMKIIYPHKKATKDQIKELLEYAIEGRKRVKDQLIRIDETFLDNPVNFQFKDRETGQFYKVETQEYRDYGPVLSQPEQESGSDGTTEDVPVKPASDFTQKELVHGANRVIRDNDKGISYRLLFMRHLLGSKEIHLTDAYIRKFYQVRNLHEFCMMLLEIIPFGEELTLKVYTKRDPGSEDEQEDYLDQLVNTFEPTPLNVQIHFEEETSIHDRSIESDNGWKISLGRGLDIFYPYEYKDAFNLSNYRQEERRCKAFEVIYLRR